MPEKTRLQELYDAPDVVVEHRKRWYWFMPEKRIVRRGDLRWVLERSWWPWQTGRLARMLDKLQHTGAAGQTVALRGKGLTDYLACRGSALALTYEPGVPLARCRMQTWHAEALGRLLAQWHRVEADRAGWALSGWPWPVQGDHGPGVWATAWRTIQTAEGMTDTAREALRAFLKECEPWLKTHQRFQLTHGDAHAKNFLVDEITRRICLIDPELAAYDFAGLEVAYVLVEVMQGNRREYHDTWLDAYLAHCTPAVRDDWMNHGGAYLVLHHLRRAARRTASILRRQRLGLPLNTLRFETLRQHHFQTAVRLASAWLSGNQEPLLMLKEMENSSKS